MRQPSLAALAPFVLVRPVALAALVALTSACGSSPGHNEDPVDDGIAAARAAADGAGLALPIRGATVTYIKPQLGAPASDPAGFTIQGSQLGPALFVAVDPTTVSPAPAVGDVVDFTITSKTTVAMQPRAQAISGYARTGTADVAALIQDLSSATDLVTAVDRYDSELVTITGTVVDAPASAGTGFVSATLATTGIAGTTDLKLRAPATVADAIDMTKDCRVTATAVPMGRFNAQAQVGAFASAELALTGCPAPAVVSAVALSPTSLRLTFSRNIKPTSVRTNGSQFTFDRGLTASAAVVSGRSVTLTTTAQAFGAAYKATIASTVTDLQGTPVAAPGNAAFAGYAVPAQLRINELNANIAGGCDLVELRVLSDGLVAGFRLTERTGTVANGDLAYAFPSFFVRRNDFIVVHLNAGTEAAPTSCNPNHATQETTAINEQAAAAFAGNFDTAYDLWAVDSGLYATTNTLSLVDGAGKIIDAVVLSDATTDAVAASSKTGVVSIAAAHQWTPEQAAYTDAEFRAAAVEDLDATGTAATGTSLQRLGDGDANGKADWTAGAGAAPTWGALNAGQQAITGGSGAQVSVHTALGLPAPASDADPNAYLSVKSQYVLSYNSSRKVPNWVSWELNSSYIGTTGRQDTFRPDDTLPANLPQAQLSDYSGSGFDRGHMCPSADRTLTVAANSQTFYLSNMVPQAANNNQGPWEKLESASRAIVATGKQLYIISGGVFGATPRMVGNGLIVPDSTFKVVVVLDQVGQGAAQVTAATRVIAVLMPNDNAQIAKGDAWETYRVSVDMIEALTGYDLLSDVDPSIQAVIEARVDNL